MKTFLSIAAIVIGSSLSMGCLNRATFASKDGNYALEGRSSNPEMMANTLSVNRSREIYAGAYATAVAQGTMYPYGNVGPVGDYRRYYCPNGNCIAPLPQPAPAPATTPTTAPTTTPAEKPVTRKEFEEAQARLAETAKKADASIGILKTIRKENKQETPPATPPAVQPLSTTTASAPEPMARPEIDLAQKQANEARKRAEAVTASK